MSNSARRDVDDRGLRRWLTIGMFAVLALCGGVVLWATLTAISGAVIAQGFISVESRIKSVQHAEGGTVSELFVREGDLVNGGDLLLRLDATDLKANLTIVETNLLDFYAQRARLVAERDDAPEPAFQAPVDANSADPAVSKVVASQRASFEARRSTRNGQVQLLKQKVEQIQQDLNGLLAQLASRRRQLELAETELATLKPLFAAGNTTRQRVLAIEREVVSLTGDIGKAESEIARNRVLIDEAELQILQVGKDFHEKVARELQDVQTKIPELEEKRGALTAKLKLVEVRAPVSGMVLNLSIVTVGGVVTPAKEILQIVPQNDRLIVEARVTPSDLDKVHLGQDAFVRISAFDSRRTPQLNGTITMISGAQVVDPQTQAPYIKVNLEIPKHEVSKLRTDQTLRPGMPAEAFIRTGDRTVLDYLTKPIWDHVERAWRER